jgi:hypothetical protein
MPSKLDDVLVQADLCETSCDARAQPRRWAFLIAHGIAQNLSYFLLGAAAMVTGASLELRLHVVLELSDQNLSHGMTIARYH